MKLAVAHAVPVGGFTGWRQAMAVTQWSVTKPATKAADPADTVNDAHGANNAIRTNEAEVDRT